MIALFLSLPIVIGSYVHDEGVSGYLPAAGLWLLEEIDGAPAPVAVALSFTEGGLRAEGECLRLSAEQGAPYPWFEATGIEAEGVGNDAVGCPPGEAAFAEALGRVIVAEVLGEVLILSDPGTLEMVFRLAPQP